MRKSGWVMATAVPPHSGAAQRQMRPQRSALAAGRPHSRLCQSGGGLRGRVGESRRTLLAEPAAFRLDRPVPWAHVAFGAGPHICPGAALARLGATIALEVFSERVERSASPSPRATPLTPTPSSGPTARGHSRCGSSSHKREVKDERRCTGTGRSTRLPGLSAQHFSRRVPHPAWWEGDAPLEQG